MPKEFAIPFLLLMLALWVYLLLAGRIGIGALIGLLLASTFVSVVIYKVDELTELGAKTKWGEVLAKMEGIRADVFAKADAVQRMGEDIGAAIALSFAGMWRLAPEDYEHQLGQRREQLRELLRKIGTDTARIAELIEPLTQTIRDDLAGEVVNAAVEALKERLGPITNKDQSDEFSQRAQALNEVRSRLIDAPAGEAATAARSFLEPKGLWTPAVEAAVQRFEEFRRTGHVTPKPAPAAS
jgi:hypothetical protein